MRLFFQGYHRYPRTPFLALVVVPARGAGMGVRVEIRETSADGVVTGGGGEGVWRGGGLEGGHRVPPAGLPIEQVLGEYSLSLPS